MPADFLALARERVLILDGGMGTSLHRYHPKDQDWGYSPGGKSLLNLSDALVYTHPEWIAEIHRGFFEAGCDGIETNTFNATQLVLDEFGMGDKLDEINRENIRIAKTVAAEFTTADRPRFVIGSVGPGTKMPSLTDPGIYADFDKLAGAYRRQLQIMIEERVDAILIETCFDILQAKCVAITAIEEMKQAGVRLPLMVQLTIIDQNKKMLPGTDIPAALVALDPIDEIDVVGMNCGVGPDLMDEEHSAPESAQPETAQRAAQRRHAADARRRNVLSRSNRPGSPTGMERFVGEYGVNIVGGCCGTTHDAPESRRRSNRRAEAEAAESRLPAADRQPAIGRRT